VNSDCDDLNACTLDACVQGKCERDVAPDGDAKDQKDGDCSRTVCKLGIASEVVDNGDVPDDDEECTLDSCENGVAFNKPVLDGTKCKIGAGSGTCTAGKCLVLCTASNATIQCNDQNPCTSDACVECTLPECGGKGICENQGLSGMPTPGVSQQTGDCREHRCVEGKDTDAIDNFDIPVDGNFCTEDVCKNGEPANPPAAAGTACTSGGGTMCDGAGKCVDCLTAADCPTSSSVCYEPTCSFGSCTTAPAPAGTPLPASQQNKGDCRTYVCDGSGSTTSQADPTDIEDDGNTCTSEVCSGTTPTHPKLPAGTACGTNGEVCSSSGICCTPTTCAAASKQCGSMSNGCGQVIDCGSCASGQVCTTSGQCCTPKTCQSGVSCGNISNGCGGTIACGACSAGDTCSGGTCGCANGYKSGSETDVDCGGLYCGKCILGQKCLAGSDCSSGFCADGVCCDTACAGNCRACTSIKTGVTTGTCANTTDGTDPDNECPYSAASTCGTTGFCKTGACEYYASGTTCSTATCSANVEYPADTCNGSGQCVDGGSNACGGSYVCSGSKCQSCSDGLKNGTETDVDCGGGGSCGKCANGKKCTGVADCTSGNCVDGVCCNTACTGTCLACNLSGTVGSCSPIAAGTDPANECPGNQSCNGAGGCN